jgi:magnesium-transporting ATPase (P-type)
MFFGAVLAGTLGLEDTGEAIAVPLLATDILWINLLTDSAPAIALGMDAPPDDVMRRRRAASRTVSSTARCGSASPGSARSWPR